MSLSLELLVVAFLVALAVPVWEVWVAASSRYAAGSNGSVVLKHPPQVRALAWVGLVLLSAAPVIVIAGGTATGPWAIGIGAGLFLFAAIYFMETRSRVTLDELGIHDFKLWRGKRTMKWSDVTNVRSGAVANWLVVTDARGGVIRFSESLKGIDTFWEYCKRYLKPPVYDAALPCHKRTTS